MASDSTVQLRSAKKNMQSALKNPKVVDDYLAHETTAGNILGPFDMGAFPDLQVNSFGVIP